MKGRPAAGGRGNSATRPTRTPAGGHHDSTRQSTLTHTHKQRARSFYSPAHTHKQRARQFLPTNTTIIIMHDVSPRDTPFSASISNPHYSTNHIHTMALLRLSSLLLLLTPPPIPSAASLTTHTTKPLFSLHSHHQPTNHLSPSTSPPPHYHSYPLQLCVTSPL